MGLRETGEEGAAFVLLWAGSVFRNWRTSPAVTTR
jgi:hypothetical protein